MSAGPTTPPSFRLISPDELAPGVPYAYAALSEAPPARC